MGLEALSGGFSLDLVGCRPVLMLRLALLAVQEDTSPVAINPFLGSGSLFVHPEAALATRSRSIARRMSRKSSRGTALSAIWKSILRHLVPANIGIRVNSSNPAATRFDAAGFGMIANKNPL